MVQLLLSRQQTYTKRKRNMSAFVGVSTANVLSSTPEDNGCHATRPPPRS